MTESTGQRSDMEGDVSRSKGRKTFVPLENNPEVMTSMVHRLGLSHNLAFHDVYSLTDESLLSFLPRPALALLLVFPITDRYEKFRREEDAGREEYQGRGNDHPQQQQQKEQQKDKEEEEEEIIWFKQTIGNACGLIGLLHSVCNGGARDQIRPESDLARLLTEARPLGPTDRADLLYHSHALEEAHAEAARHGDSAPPPADVSLDLHFVAFVKDHRGRLWELDGRRKGPLDRGELAADEDVLSVRGLELGVQAFLDREERHVAEHGAGAAELRFSVVMLGPTLD